MGFTEKTNYLLETKSKFKDRINSLGGSITSGTTFRDYLVWLDSLYEALDEMTITGLPDSLEGKCEQEGTPTPSSPIPINITTGRQVVSVCGKNLFSDTLRQGVTTYNTGVWSNSNTRITSTDWITLKAGTYTISANTTITGNRYLQVSCVTFDTSGNFYNISGVSGQWKRLPFTFTTPIDINWKCNISFNDSYSLTPSDVYDIQIEKGNQATTYEEYKGNTYEINLGKNLLNIQDRSVTNSGLTATMSDGSVSISGTSTATSFLNVILDTLTLEKGTYTISAFNPVASSDSGMDLRITSTGGTTVKTRVYLNVANNKATFTLDEDLINGRVQVRASSGKTFDNFTLTPMIEKGTGTSHSPYKTPIYLGEIGNYKDYIFKNTPENPLYDSNLEEGQWYLHKEVGKVVLNGSDTTFSGISGTRNTGYSRFYVSVLNPLRQPNNVVGKVMCNRLVAGTLDDTYLGNEAITSWDGGDRLYLYINDIATYNLNNANTWLQTHNMVIYYVLNTPTNTLIEDEELINQLNEIDIFTVISEDFYN